MRRSPRMNGDKVQQCTLHIGGMDCADCAVKLKQGVGRIEGIESVRVQFMDGTMDVTYNPALVDEGRIAERVRRLGYQVGADEGAKEVTLFVEGMDCADESSVIEKTLRSTPGVLDVQFNLVAQEVTVRHRLTTQQVMDLIKGAGFTARPVGHGDQRRGEITFWDRRGRLILAIIAGLFTAAGILHNRIHVPDPLTIPLYLIAMISGGYPVARKGILAVWNRSLDINFLMTMAVVGAALIGAWDEGAMVIFLFAVANLLESYSLERARNAIRSLMDLSPKVALVRRSDSEVTLSVGEVCVGDVLIVKPGEKIPLDGVVLSGSSSVNQAPITGESMPVSKTEGEEVYAGALNGQGVLEVEVTHVSEDTTLARIIHLVEEAQSQRAPSQHFVDRFARIYTPVVVCGAVLVALVPPLGFGGSWGTWFYRALVLLVISCPCALVISTPVTLVSGLARAARDGILMKGGVVLENAGRLNAMAFDKTGTLTQGVPEVMEVLPVSGYTERDLLQKAASVERRSEHALAAAILRRAEQEGLALEETTEFRSITGKGAQARLNGEMVLIGNHRLFEERGLCTPEADRRAAQWEAEGKTTVYVGTEGEMLGMMAIADTVREEARESLEALRRSGVHHLVLLTGDNRGTAEAIAREVGLDAFQAELLPGDKVRVVKEIQSRYGAVGMVGDGVNDAPALAASTIGIAMGAAGTDTALETADIALMADDLFGLPAAMHLSRKALRIIQENIALSIGIKAAFLGLAISGLATLWMAVLADTGVSLLVVLNGLRMLKRRRG